MSYVYKTTIGQLSNKKQEIITALESYINDIGYKHDEDLTAQKVAWEKEIDFLISAFNGSDVDGNIPIIFEYMLPNENTERPDVVLLCEGKIISLEFKTSGHIVDMDYATQFIGYKDFFENYHQYNIENNLVVESYLVMSDAAEVQI